MVFTGEIVMWIIIFAWLKPNAFYETGFDPTAEVFVYWLDDNFL